MSSYDILVVGGAGIDTIVRVPDLQLPVADSLHVPPIRDYVAHTGNGVALACHALGLRCKFIDFIGDDAHGARGPGRAGKRRPACASHAGGARHTATACALADRRG